MIRCLVFDLCDTVVRTAGVQQLLRLPGVGAGWDADRLEQWFRANPVYYAYERGQADTGAFIASLHRALAPRLAPERLAAAYAALVVAEEPGIAPLLRELHGRVRLAALSNNNPLLWRGTERVCTCLPCFEAIFLSHQTGLLKPEAAAYHHALGRLGVGPDEVLLIDDNPACVRAAADLGIAALHYVGIAALREQLVPQLGTGGGGGMGGMSGADGAGGAGAGDGALRRNG